MIVVAGEALIDLTPHDGVLVPLAGGSPYNVAIGLGRLGIETAYLGRLSTDGFGRMLASRLQDEDVSTAMVTATDDLTTLAVVHLDDAGYATYGFYLDGTSAAGFTAAELPRLAAVTAVHVSLGAVTLDTDPAGQALDRLIGADAPVVSLDPNVRPAVIRDLRAYARRLDRAVAQCDLIKVSDQDVADVHPDQDLDAVAGRWLESGPELVVVTRGAAGAVAFGHTADRVTVAAEPVEVVDTIGAGDAFTSGLLAWLDRQGHLTPGALGRLDGDEVTAALTAAARTAAITCTRAGSDPPRLEEL